MTVKKFQKIIWDYYAANKRDFPWRNTWDPYHILVSEVMLQQTQVSRVLVKYPEFMMNFPTIASLSKATLKEVLSVWQGMGYNRRALYLYATSKMVIEKYNAKLPSEKNILITLPGIGAGTAGAIMAFAFNKPVAFIETNIRRVFIHFFYENKSQISDRDILTFVEKTIDKQNPREWYYALMDYGTMLGKTRENPNRRSKIYSKQSKFEGSDRQIRGYIIKNLLKTSISEKTLINNSQFDSDRVKKILSNLKKEGLINSKRRIYYVT